MSQRNEEFLHFDNCIDRLNEAWMTLTTIRDYRDHPLAGAAFRFGLVSYAAPYTGSEGILKKSHRLDKRHIPAEFNDLHKRLLSARHKIHAHTDLNALDPRLSFDDRTGQRLVMRSQNHVNALEEMENLEQIICLIERTLSNMYVAREELKAGLEP